MNYAVGDMVKFKWWSPYKAPSTCTDSTGHLIWKEIFPAELGIVIQLDDGTNTNTLVIFFSRINMMLKINENMLEKVNIVI